jgi:hypothetical protein
MHIEQAETCPLRGNELGAGRFHMTAGGGYEMCPKAADAVDWLYDPVDGAYHFAQGRDKRHRRWHGQ